LENRPNQNPLPNGDEEFNSLANELRRECDRLRELAEKLKARKPLWRRCGENILISRNSFTPCFERSMNSSCRRAGARPQMHGLIRTQDISLDFKFGQ
jgi:hypothetical protein